MRQIAQASSGHALRQVAQQNCIVPSARAPDVRLKPRSVRPWDFRNASMLRKADQAAWEPGTLHPDSRSFQRKQPVLPLRTPTIARKSPITSYGKMTRDGDRDGIADAGSGHSASGRRLADRTRNLLIGMCLSVRNLLQRLPLHATLSATHWQIFFTRSTLRLFRDRFPGTCQ